MENQANDPTVKTPWEWLAEIANRVLHKKQRDHARVNDGLIHAGTHDFEEAFQLPMKLVIAEAEMALIMKHASRELPSLGKDAIAKQGEINKLRFELARKDRPDER